MTNVNPMLRVPSVAARTPSSKASLYSDAATPPSSQAMSETSSSPYSPLSLEGGEEVSALRPIRMDTEDAGLSLWSNRDEGCFPLDLDLVPVFQQQTSKEEEYSIADLQRISREARGRLMELTVSRHGRELQRWEYLGDPSSQQPFNHTAPPPNCRLTTGCIPILPGGRVVLISSSKSRNVFVLPKGGWEQDESLPLSALRETLEEAGVTGLLGPPLPALTYETKKSVHRRRRRQQEQQQNEEAHSNSHCIVTSESPVSSDHTHNRLVLFPMYVQCMYEHWPEREKRTRRTVTMDEAAELLQHRPEFSYMLQELLKRQWHLIVDEHQASSSR
jgi:8-oxo-dGTP pyrophosphatase MutT (NUDIX family)